MEGYDKVKKLTIHINPPLRVWMFGFGCSDVWMFGCLDVNKLKSFPINIFRKIRVIRINSCNSYFMKIFTTSQIRQLDQLTIEREPISSIALMERAADRILQQFKKDWNFGRDIVIFAGPGNNGGDGLALGRMLLQIGYEVQVILIHGGKISPDCKQNKDRLEQYFPDFFTEQINIFSPPEITKKTIIVDALFGSGLSKPLENTYAAVVDWINRSGNTVVAIDIPSGLCGEQCAADADPVVKANLTYTLQFPKTAFFFAENEKYTGKWKVIDIQLHPGAVAKTETNIYLTEKADIRTMLKPRERFSHKGTFGHTLIWAGKKGMAGAVVLSAKAALRSGAGLVSVHSVEDNRIILQSTVPEAIFVSELPDLTNYNSIAIGPGLGTDFQTTEMLFEMLKTMYKPCVLDADALNIISRHKNFLEFVPENSILTPHPKEFDRLFGASTHSQERMEKAITAAREHGLVIVLKGANTFISTPAGKLYINFTGNPGMAVGGMGDALTGIIAGMLAQGYSPVESSISGVYLHGLAGDLALSSQSEESLLPSDLIQNLGNAFTTIRKS